MADWLRTGLCVFAIVSILSATTIKLLWDGARDKINRAALAKSVSTPERRWRYDQLTLENFIEALAEPEGEDPKLLTLYADRVLPWDTAFAITFALGTAALCEWAALSEWPSLQQCAAAFPRLAAHVDRIAFVLGALALCYGGADVSENVLLREIMRRGRLRMRQWVAATADLAAAEKESARNKAKREGRDVVDAAQADAACLLTRLKMAYLFLSVIGGALWVVMSALSWMVSKFRRPDQDRAAGKGASRVQA